MRPSLQPVLHWRETLASSVANVATHRRLILVVMACVLLLSGCMLSPLFQAPAVVMTGIAVLLGLAACSSGGGGGGGGGDSNTGPTSSKWPAETNLNVLFSQSGLGWSLKGLGRVARKCWVIP